MGLIKAGLAPYWDMHPPHGPTAVKKAFNSGNIELIAEFGSHGVDLHVHTAQMHSHYENVEILGNLQNSLRNARVPSSKLLAYQTGLIGICNVAAESIVTFDNVTLKYECPTCYTLVSAWNSPPPTAELKSVPTAEWSPSVKISLSSFPAEEASSNTSASPRLVPDISSKYQCCCSASATLAMTSPT